MFVLPIPIAAQSITEYGIDEIHEVMELKDGVPDEHGKEVSVLYVPTELEQGRYEVTITSTAGSSGLYHVKNTDYYISFQGFYGFVGFSGDEGILDIGFSDWDRYFFKFED